MNPQTFYIARNGYQGAFILLLAFILCLILSWNFLALVLFLGLAVWVFAFRNPERIATHLSQNAFLSPIDGEITEIQTTGNQTKIAIKVGFFDVGVLRAPQEIRDFQVDRVCGAPLLFFSKKDFFAPITTIKTNNQTMILMQNLLHSFPLHQGKDFERGERMGFLKAGKVILEVCDIELKVNIGDRIKGGESVIGYLQ